ncbi:hypothetical protein BLA29_007546 [Euroglyphus maynei]|uniref:pseudouridine 5'-phosphatase n=1 Tax=Euroglyphus maynei TaxID=6958 RepID=A0A1Y3BGY6_EURMA|nr:hypothetical protein BLA29_007546 [Euroglyphus maynei]
MEQNTTSSHRITHVIFDMDGLILDTEKLYEKAYKNVLGNYGKEYTLDLKIKIMGRSGLEGARIIIDDCQLPLNIDGFLSEMAIEHEKVFAGHVPLMPGAERLIRHFHHHRIPIAVATSSKRYTFDLKTKEHRELFQLFDHIVIASEDPEITAGKPDPQTFLVCASRFRPPPTTMTSVLVFEDSANGVLAANAANMISVWIPDPQIRSAKQHEIDAHYTLNSLLDFKPEQFSLPPLN